MNTARVGLCETRAWVAFMFVVCIGISATPAAAQNATWDTAVTTGGSWGVSTNWAGGTPASGAGSTATFGLDFVAGSSVTLDGNRTIGTVMSTSTNPWSVDEGSGGVLTVGNFTVNGTGAITVTADLAGTTFAKNGTGSLILANGNNTYTGAIAINAGTLSLIGSGNYATGATTLSIATGATLDVSGLTSGLRFGGAGTAFDALNGDVITGTGTINGGIRAGAGSTVYPGNSGVGTLNVNGSVSFDAGSFWQVRALSANPGNSNSSNQLAVNGAMALSSGMFMPVNGAGLTLTLGETYDYTIGTVTGAISIGNVTFQPSGFSPGGFNDPSMFSLLTSGNNVILRITPVPEPALLVPVFLAAAGWIVVRRRRRTAGGPSGIGHAR